MKTDIRLSVEFWQHPKTYRLEKRIGLKGVRSLQILWCWCAKNRPDGKLEGLEIDEIEFVADWRGKKGAFVQACVGSWIDQTDSGLWLHEWAEYNPYQAQAGSREEARKEKARKAANARWQKQSSENADGCPNDATSNAQAMPSLTSTSTKHIKSIKKPPYIPRKRGAWRGRRECSCRQSAFKSRARKRGGRHKSPSHRLGLALGSCQPAGNGRKSARAE